MGRRKRRSSELLELSYEPGEAPLLISRGLQSGDAITLRPSTINKKGDGRTTVSAKIGPQGEERTYVIDARRALPGDLVKVVLDSRKRTSFGARVVERLEASPKRIEARCRHFGEREDPGKGCGGCSLQSLDYGEQLTWKETHIKRLLTASDVSVASFESILGMDEPFNYRNKMEYSFGDDRARDFACGLFPQGWHNEVINLDECHLQSADGVELLKLARTWCEAAGLRPYKARDGEGFLKNLAIREGKRTGDRLIDWVTTSAERVVFRGEDTASADVARAFSQAVVQAASDAGVALTSVYWTQQHVKRGEKSRSREVLLYGRPLLEEVFKLDDGRDVRFQIHPRSFFQPNSSQGERLASLVVRLALEGAESQDPRRVLDLYCGAGNLALCVAPYATTVLGIDLVPEAVADARQNARLNGFEHVSFEAADVGAWLESAPAQAWRSGTDVVLLDPPRAGLLGTATEHLAALAPQRIVYVSCNPESLARDLARILPMGYEVTRICPVDMFPHTAHVETVVALERHRDAHVS